MIDCGYESISERILIGKGGQASIYKVSMEEEGGNVRNYALKQIDVRLDSFATVVKQANFFKKFFRELEIIQKIKQSNTKKLLKYHGFQVRINRYLCLELSLTSDLMKMDLQRYLNSNRNLSLIEKVELCIEISEGLEELSRLKIIHGDVKP